MARNVKIIPAKSKEWREDYNRIQDRQTKNAKSGEAVNNLTARRTESENTANRAAGKTPKIKIDSNPVPGKTVVGPLARGAKSGGIAGLALGAISAYKEEAARIAAMKRKENRIS